MAIINVAYVAWEVKYDKGVNGRDDRYRIHIGVEWRRGFLAISKHLSKMAASVVWMVERARGA
jgi:hypothetical protein